VGYSLALEIDGLPFKDLVQSHPLGGKGSGINASFNG
jgi:hypothetical protein